MTEPYVEANSLSKSFGPKVVLRDVTLAVEPGDVIGVLGKNGAGKTTLLELMLGFTPASSGHVQIFGHDSLRLPASSKARIGFVPQLDELIAHLTGRDQLKVISSFYSGWNDALVARLAQRWEIALDDRIRDMSIGQRQKLSILLALGHEPDLLILDEPVASLDPVARRYFLEELVDIATDRERAVILSSHLVSDIERLANKIWIVKDNTLYWAGDFDELRESIVRLHIRSTRPLAKPIEIPNALSIEVGESHATAVVRDSSAALCRRIEDASGGKVEVEALTLEDIFVEFHR